jgi:hypothetical protein
MPRNEDIKTQNQITNHFLNLIERWMEQFFV